MNITQDHLQSIRNELGRAAPQVIGYGEQTQAAFAHGHDHVKNRMYNLLAEIFGEQFTNLGLSD